MAKTKLLLRKGKCIEGFIFGANSILAKILQENKRWQMSFLTFGVENKTNEYLYIVPTIAMQFNLSYIILSWKLERYW